MELVLCFFEEPAASLSVWSIIGVSYRPEHHNQSTFLIFWAINIYERGWFSNFSVAWLNLSLSHKRYRPFHHQASFPFICLGYLKQKNLTKHWTSPVCLCQILDAFPINILGAESVLFRLSGVYKNNLEAISHLMNLALWFHYWGGFLAFLP